MPDVAGERQIVLEYLWGYLQKHDDWPSEETVAHRFAMSPFDLEDLVHNAGWLAWRGGFPRQLAADIDGLRRLADVQRVLSCVPTLLRDAAALFLTGTYDDEERRLRFDGERLRRYFDDDATLNLAVSIATHCDLPWFSLRRQSAQRQLLLPTDDN